MLTCRSCGQEVPETNFCVVCGFPLGTEDGPGDTTSRRRFSAAPHERTGTPLPLSTIFPRLPRAKMQTFYSALVAGMVVTLALTALRFFPLAIAAAAVLIPLLALIYVYDADVYEDEPLYSIAATFLSGIVAGVITAVVGRAVAPTDLSLEIGGATSHTLVRGVALPVLGLALILVGPLLLLRWQRFNDALDGVTFGVASGAAFAAALTLTQSSDLFQVGLRPFGSVSWWLARIVELGLEMPLLFAAVAGSICGSVWIRFRGSAREEKALGRIESPLDALAIGAAMLVAAALIQLYLAVWIAALALALLTCAALVVLRYLIHVGLMEEAAEIPIGPDITCPNCGEQTPQHTFCGNCGVSFQALPKARHT